MPETPTLDSIELSDHINATIDDRTSLRQFSPKNKKWDDRRAESDRIAELYKGTILDPLAGKIEGCAGRLWLAWQIGETGDRKLKLRAAWFCRNRQCSICQWRKSSVWRYKAFQIIPKIVKAYPKHRFILLTLTIRNCHVTDLRAALEKMSKAWMRLTKRKQWPADGWLRSLEITRGSDDTCHPHYHCLLMVKPSYFSHGYISQQTWTDLWQQSLQIDYPPVVDVRTVKPKKGTDNDNLGAILETLKYTVKPSDMMGDMKGEITDKDKDWLVDFTCQIKGNRTVATGGILKEYLKELENEPEDLIHIDENGKIEDNGNSPSIVFEWEKPKKQYLMAEDEL